jgi:hypothetical protein
MLSDIFLTIPYLVMASIAWYMRVGIALICLIVLFAVAVGVISFRRLREGSHPVPQGHRPESVSEA